MKKELAIYATSETFSLKMIEQCLKSLKNKETNEPLFQTNSIVNFNDLISIQENQIEAEKALNNLLLGRTYVISEDVKKNLDKVGDNIRQYKRFLQINTNSFEGFIEYQLLLYPILDNSDLSSGILDFNNVNFTTRVFKHDTKVEELERIIENVLKGLFYESHLVPKGIISIDSTKLNGIIDSSENKVYVAIGDTVFFNAIHTIDLDTPDAFLKYKWKTTLLSGSLNGGEKILDHNGVYYHIIPKSKAVYQVVLEVEDGVQKTKEIPYGLSARDTIIVVAVYKPKANIYPDKIRSHYVKSIDDNHLAVYPSQKLIISSTSTPYRIYTTNDRLLVSNVQNQEPEDVVDVISYSNTQFIEVSYLATNEINEKIPIRIVNPNKIFVEQTIDIRHKVYKPIYFGSYWTMNDILLNIDAKNIDWNNPALFMYTRLVPRFDIGVGWGFRRENLDFNTGESLSISSSIELLISYKLLEGKQGNLFMNGGLKSLRVTENSNEYTEWIFNVRGGAEVSLLQGLFGLNLEIGFLGLPLSDDLISSYTQWLSLGLKYYIKN